MAGAAGFPRGDGDGGVGGGARARGTQGKKAWGARSSGTRTADLARGRGSGRLRGTAPPTRAGRAAPPCPARLCGACAATSATSISWPLAG